MAEGASSDNSLSRHADDKETAVKRQCKFASPLGGAGEDAADGREELFLAADYAVHLEEVGGEVGEVNFIDHGLAAGGEEQAVVLADIGDDQAGEVILPVGGHGVQRLAEFVRAAGEVFQTQLFDLADADVPAVFDEFLAVGVEDGFGRGGTEQGAGGKEVAGEFIDHNPRLAGQPAEDLAVGIGGGGGSQIQGVADQPAAEADGHGGGRAEAG